jgi:hypothetical protein
VRVILLGPQRRPTIGAVMASLDLGGPIATITAGWQEREPADSELSELLGGRDVNLSLYQRWLDVQDRDPGFAAAQRDLQGLLDEAQDIYLLRLDHALAAVYAIARRGRPERHRADGRQADARDADARDADARRADARHADPPQADPHRVSTLQAEALAEAVAAVAELDAAHLHRANAIRGEFYARWQPHTRPEIAEHRAAVERVLGDAAAVVIAGGHVGVLTDALHLFNVAPALTSTVLAWSAGAMALTDQIVLFGDRSAHGPGHPEVYGAGLSVLRNLVVLPHARARLLLDDAPRMAVFARRFTPARCVLLENGARVDTGSDGSCPAGTQLLGLDGRVTTLAAA